MMRTTWMVMVGLLSSATALADGAAPLRIATVAPSGTAWAREMNALARDVAQRTEGRTTIKMYFNGVAGDELEMLERTRRGQLDGVVSGGMACERMMPSMRITRLPGMFQSSDEAKHVVNHLLPAMSQEAAEQGFVFGGAAPLGVDVIFSRRPIQSMAELRHLKIWRWDLDSVGIALSRRMGLDIVSTTTEQARRAYDEGRFDAYWSIPAAALAFQWSVQAPYLTSLSGSFLYGCILLSNRALYSLPPADQKAMLAAMAKVADRFDELSRQQDEALLGGLFQHQGVKVVPVSDSFRAEFFAAASKARRAEENALGMRALIEKAQDLLADYRAEHQRAAR